jgi:hypothetical protein
MFYVCTNVYYFLNETLLSAYFKDSALISAWVGDIVLFFISLVRYFPPRCYCRYFGHHLAQNLISRFAERSDVFSAQISWECLTRPNCYDVVNVAALSKSFAIVSFRKIYTVCLTTDIRHKPIYSVSVCLFQEKLVLTTLKANCSFELYLIFF